MGGSQAASVGARAGNDGAGDGGGGGGAGYGRTPKAGIVPYATEALGTIGTPGTS